MHAILKLCATQPEQHAAAVLLGDCGAQVRATLMDTSKEATQELGTVTIGIVTIAMSRSIFGNHARGCHSIIVVIGSPH
jgi:hypothetical protein